MRNLKSLLLVSALSIAACANSGYVLTPSSDVPAGVGSVKVNQGANGNSEIHLEVRHLAPAARVAPGATTWVVWTRAVSGNPVAQNAGALLLNDAEGHLDTVSPLHAFQIFLTAEPSAQVNAPTGKPQFLTDIGMN